MVITWSEHNNVHDGYLNKDFLGTNMGKQPNKVHLCMEKSPDLVNRSFSVATTIKNHNRCSISIC